MNCAVPPRPSQVTQGFLAEGRVELLYRLERAFAIKLPEELLGEAETPGDLLAAVLEGSGAEEPALALEPVLGVLEPAEAAPRAAASSRRQRT